MSLPPLRSRAKSRAFTLIELLTVIAIIGILAAIIIPVVGKVRDTARSSQCLSNVRQITLALRMHANDNRGLLPVANATGGGWSVALTPFLPSGNYVGARNPVWICPTNNFDTLGTGNLPVAQTYSMGPGAAGLNDPSFPNDSNGNIARNVATILNPSRAIWVMDGSLQDPVNKSAYNVIQRAQLGRFSTGDTGGHVSLRHGNDNRANLAFADGSARSCSPVEFSETYSAVTTTPGWRKAAGL